MKGVRVQISMISVSTGERRVPQQVAHLSSLLFEVVEDAVLKDEPTLPFALHLPSFLD